MLLKLYKKENGKTLYWEAWDEGDDVVVHFGEVGQAGQTTTLSLPEFEPPETAINKQAAEARAAGFAEVEHGDLVELIVQYSTVAKNEDEELEQAYQVEEVLNDCLGWTGLGHCDGSEMGGQTLNVYCYVLDARLAAKAIVEDLRTNGLLDGAVIAYQDQQENFVVLWPENYQGVFEY